jgi:PAS domain S-box-containing protein
MPDRAGGEIAHLIAEREGSRSPLGPPSQWPQDLRDAVRLIFPAAVPIVMFWGADYLALYNDAYASTIGDKHPAAFGRPGREFWSELWDEVEPLLRRVRETGETISARDRGFCLERHGHAEEVFLDISYSPLRDEGGAVAGVLCIIDETTTRVVYRARLQFQLELGDLLRPLSDPQAIMAAAAERLGQRLGADRTGYAELEDAGTHFAVTRDWTSGVLPSLAGSHAVAPFGPLVIEACRSGQTLKIDDSQTDPKADGAREALAALGVRATLTAPLLKDGRCVAVLFVHSARPRRWTEMEVALVEATAERTGAAVERTKTEARLRFSDERLRAATEAANIGSWDLDVASGALRWDDRCKAIFGLSPEAEVTLQETFVHALHPEDRPAVEAAVARALDPAQRASYDTEFRIVDGDGHERWLSATGRASFHGDKAVRFIGTVIDITERRRAEAALAESEAALQRLTRTLEQEVAARTAERDRIWQVAGDLLGVADMQGVWLSVNPAWSRVLGWSEEEIVGRSTAWIGHPDESAMNREQVTKLAAGAKTLAFENRLRTREGDYRTMSWTVAAEDGKIYCTARDVTAERERQKELDEVQERLRQSQKMETVGQLTGGVAHDFNNLLQIIAGNLDLLLRTLPPDAARQRRAAERAMSGAKRAATLTERLLAFSRRQPLSPKPLNANRLISGMSELLHRSLGETIEVEVVLSASLWRAEVDPNALENAILNLALNARDAMADGGKLTIETANSHLDRDYVAQHPELTTGQYVSISVSDTGHGMRPEVVERVFEPFFTTKEVGKGTGLGLSMVYGFVKQSGGHVKVYSEPGQGTTVRLYLPRLLADAPEEAEPPPPPALERARQETILVCEDDPEVRAFSAEVLRELGYTVREAVDGPSALRLLEREDGRVDLLFTDVVLPGGMTGSTLAEHARRARPGVKVLFTTGYARNAIVHHGRLDPGVELITKPFSYADLAGRIRDLLDAPPAP